MRQHWFDAFAAMNGTGTVDMRTLPDSSLVHMRDSYRDETGCVPPHVGRQIREVRLGAETMRLRAVRADAEARVAQDWAGGARQANISAKARELEVRYREHESILAGVMDDRRPWNSSALTQGPSQSRPTASSAAAATGSRR